MRTTFEFGTHKTPGPTPLRIVVAGDWCCGGERNKPVRVDKGNFQQIFKAHAGELVFEVPNHLASHPDQLLIQLQIDSLNSFSPVGLAAKVPELQRALNLRDQLAALASGELDYAEFESGLNAYKGLDAFAKALHLCDEAMQTRPGKVDVTIPDSQSSAPVTPTKNTDDDDIDRILNMVEGRNANSTPAAVSQLQQVISGIGKSSKRTATTPGYTAAIDAVEDILSRQLDEILHHPGLQACEASWSGLKFLVDRTDFRKDIYIELCSIDRERFGEGFAEQILSHEQTGQVDIPLGLVIMAFAIDNHPSDLQQLQLLGEAAGGLQVPVLISASPAFFQLDTGSQTSAIPYPGGLLSQPEYDKWNALRDKDASRWLTVCFNRFLLRSPYQAQHRYSIGLTETIHQPDDFLWGEPAWILASLITASFARCGWPTEITGMDHGQMEDLPLHRLARPDGQEMQIPLESMLSGQLAEDLAASGFTPLICKPNRDSAYVLWAPMLHRPEIYADAAATAASRAMAHLPYQLLANRISETVASNLPQLRAASLSAEELGNAIGQLLQQLVANTGAGAGVAVEVQTEADESGRRQMDIVIHTGEEVLNGAEVRLSLLA